MKNLRDEIWRDIQGYEKYYQVSNLGRVKSLQRKGVTKEYILKPLITKAGYHRVALLKNNKPKFFTIHRLLMLAFVPNLQNKDQINHIDGDKSNNVPDNLEWCNCLENRRHATEVLLVHCGENCKTSKLKEDQVLQIYNYAKEGVPGNYIARKFNVDLCTISSIRNSKSWKYLKLEPLPETNTRINIEKILEIENLLKQNISQKEIIKRCNCAGKYIRNIKNGKYEKVKIIILKQFAECL